MLSADVVEAEYRRLGFRLGWRFLTCPEKNIDDAKVALITLNPGGSQFEPARWSVEDGSAYVTESWKGFPPGRESLQLQVGRMFELMSIDPKDVLSGYLVPFRSKTWDELPHKTHSLAFGSGLWRDLFQRACTKTVIVLGKETAMPMKAVFNARIVAQQPAQWGGLTIDTYRFGKDGNMLVLPHLSRFKLFRRPESEAAFNSALASIGAAPRRV